MITYHRDTLRAALETAFRQAMRTGEEHQIGACGDSCGWDGYAVIEHAGTAYPGISAPSCWCWVATVTPEGACEHHSGYSDRWGAEIARARNAARRAA